MRRGVWLAGLGILLALHTGWWLYAGYQLKGAVVGNVEALNQILVAPPYGTHLTYDHLSFKNWPLPPALEAKNLQLVQTAPLDEFRFTAEKVTIRQSGSGEYELKLPDQLLAEESVSNRTARQIAFAPKPMPRIYFRTPDAAEKDGAPAGPLAGLIPKTTIPAGAAKDVIFQFRGDLERKVTLSTEEAGRNSSADFDIAPTLFAFWQNIPHSLDRPADLFFSLLEEIADRAPAKKG